MSEPRYVDLAHCVKDKEAARAFVHHLRIAIAYWEACENNRRIEKELKDFDEYVRPAGNVLHRELKRIYGE